MSKKHDDRENKEETLMPDEDEALVIDDDEDLERGGMHKKVLKLKGELHKCRKEREEYLDGWQRARAEFINLRKEDEHARQEFMRFAEERLILDLLEVASNFDRAFSGLDAANPYTTGFAYIRDQLMKILADHGLSPIIAEGQRFDTSLHDAIEKQDVPDETRDGMIIKELERGYTLCGKVIKASKVAVATYKPNR